MQSPNKKPQTRLEAQHVAEVAALECSVCDVPGPSEVHEIEQGKWFLTMALCSGCHRGEHNGIHGRKHLWKVKRMGELDALAVTIRRLKERARA
jgi:hypothetical protein